MHLSPKQQVVVGSCLGALISISAGLWFEWAKPHIFILPSVLFWHGAAFLSGLFFVFILGFTKPALKIPDWRIFSRHFGITLGTLLVLAFITLIWINRAVLNQFLNSADEHSCYFFAELLRQGKLWTAAPVLPEFFETPHIGIKDGKWFSVYPPGWPLLWAAGLQTGFQHVINPLLAVLGVCFWSLYGIKIYGKKVILCAILLLLASPFFLLTGAAYFSHNTCFFFAGLFCYAFYRWRTGQSSIWAFCAGLCLGYNLSTRYLTAVALAFPFGLFLAYEILKKRVRLKQLIFFCAPLILLLLMQFTYHQALTGRFWDFPNHYLRSHEKLGFISGYTPIIALQYLVARFFYQMDWVPPMTLIFFLGALFRKPVSIWDFMNRAAVLCVPFFYLFYYSWGGNQFGPRYYFESYFLLLLIAASFVKSVWNQSYVHRCWMAGSLLICFLGAVPTTVRHLAFFRQVSIERGNVYRAVQDQTQKPALVFLKGFFGNSLVMSEDDAVRNKPGFDSTLIYAHDRGVENDKLFAIYPGHFFYQAVYDNPTKQTMIKLVKAPNK